MDDYGLDEQILKELLKNLPENIVNEILKTYEPDSQQGNRLKQIIGSSEKEKEQKESENEPSLKEQWKSKQGRYKNRFNELIEKYLKSYLRGERDTTFEPSRSYLENVVNNHSKWNRMINHHGRGRQYQDDIRRLCFVFHLTFPEANELMWSAGQLFDLEDYRDFIIADCLQKGIYSFETVDEILTKEGVPVLFPITEK